MAIILPKEIKSAKKREFRLKNLEKIKAYNRTWNENHREHNRKINKFWYENFWKKGIKKPRLSTSIKKVWDITLEQYNEILDSQNGVCAICKEKPIEGKNLFIDHNHETGKVRGLLCNHCNLGIGNLKENEYIFLESIKYLKKYSL